MVTSFQVIDTITHAALVPWPAAPGDEKEYTMLGVEMGGATTSIPRLSPANGVAIGGDTIDPVVQPMPAGYYGHVTNVHVYLIDEAQNDRNCWVEAQHGHGGWWSLRKGTVGSGLVPAVVPPWSQRRAPNGAFYGYTAPWALPGFTPNGDIHQGVNFSSRVVTELAAGEYLTVSIRRKSGTDVDDPLVNRLAVTIRVTGLRLVVGEIPDLRFMPFALNI